MRELTTKQKAEAYDSMFERLKEMYNNNKTNVSARLIYERYFPELVESEDEKVRRKLISFFTVRAKHTEDSTFNGLSSKEIIAWLEKQGSHKKFRDSIQIGDKVTRNEDGILVNLSQLNRVAKKDENQGEQKPWSEADEMKLNITIAYLLDVKDFKLNAEKCIDWLKDIKGRVCCEANCTTAWKPSKEQMEALEEASNEHWEPDGLDPLYTLLQDLKKLEGK